MIINIEERQIYCSEIRLKEVGEETLLSLGTVTAWKPTVARHYQVAQLGLMQFLGKTPTDLPTGPGSGDNIPSGMLEFTTGTAIPPVPVTAQQGSDIRNWHALGCQIEDKTIMIYLNEVPAPMELGTYWWVNGYRAYLTQFGKELHFEITINFKEKKSIGYGIDEDATWSEVAPDAWGMEGE